MFHEIYSKKLKELGCIPVVCDPAFFLQRSNIGETLINTHVNDGIGIRSSIKECDSFLAAFKSCFKIEAQTDQKNYIALGLSIKLRDNEIKLSISTYINEFLHHFSEHIAVTYSTLMDLQVILLQLMCLVIVRGMGDDGITNVKSVIKIIKMKPFCSMLGTCSWIANMC